MLPSITQTSQTHSQIRIPQYTPVWSADWGNRVGIYVRAPQENFIPYFHLKIRMMKIELATNYVVRVKWVNWYKARVRALYVLSAVHAVVISVFSELYNKYLLFLFLFDLQPYLPPSLSPDNGAITLWQNRSTRDYSLESHLHSLSAQLPLFLLKTTWSSHEKAHGMWMGQQARVGLPATEGSTGTPCTSALPRSMDHDRSRSALMNRDRISK